MSDTDPTRSALFAKARDLIPFALAAYVLFLNLSLGRPIWIDEFLHFAVAAEPSSAQAWAVIQQSISGVNHGQTGTYMMLDYWLISLFGAESWALRLPSMLSGAFFVYASITLFRTLGYSLFWQTLAMLALLAQGGVMFFAGEARPYFPLVAACAGILVYYVKPPKERGIEITVIGFAAAAIGVVSHPYFAIYWPALLLVGYVTACLNGTGRPTASALLRHANVGLCLVGAAIYIVLASATWLEGGPSFSFDPLQWIREPSPWTHLTDYSHFQFLFPNLVIAAIASAAVVALLAFLPVARRGPMRGLWAPFLLLIVALALSCVLSAISYLRSYWILPRQLVASAALTVLAAVWLWAEIGRISARIGPVFALAIWLAAGYIVGGQALRVHDSLLREMNTRQAALKGTEPSICQSPPTSIPHHSDPEQANNLWVELANQNMDCCGEVWPIFGKFYEMQGYKPAQADLTLEWALKTFEKRQ